MKIDPERLDYSIADYNEFKKKVDLSPDEAIWFFIVLDAIKSFLCGEGDAYYPDMEGKNTDAREWIFGRQDYEFCFNERWVIFSDIDPDLIKKVLVKRLEQKRELHEKRRMNAENPNHHGRRGAEAGNCIGNGGGLRATREDGWIESILFQGDI